MLTTTDKRDATKEVEPKEEKRDFINIAVTKEQKNAITKEAITNCGVTVSEYCRAKILAPKQEEKEPIIISSDEATISAYEERMKKDIETIKALTEENIRLKVSKSIPVNDPQEFDENEIEENPLVNESNIIVELTPEQRTIVDLAIKYESESFFGTKYLDVNHFIKRKLGDVITSNQGSFSNDYHDKSKLEYKTAYEFIQYLKQNTENGN